MSDTSDFTVRTSKGPGTLPASSILSAAGASFFLWGLPPSMRELTGTSEYMNGGVNIFGNAGQHLAAFGGDQHVVFDANSRNSGKIDARLDGNHHAGL